jgi:hypothetical protein
MTPKQIASARAAVEAAGPPPKGHGWTVVAGPACEALPREIGSPRSNVWVWRFAGRCAKPWTVTDRRSGFRLAMLATRAQAAALARVLNAIPADEWAARSACASESFRREILDHAIRVGDGTA